VARSLPGQARAYAHCLLKTVRHLSANRAVVPVGSAMASLHDLKGRITMIMTSSSPLALSRPARAAMFVVAATLLVISPTLSARHGAQTELTGEPVSLILEDADLRDVLGTLSTVTGLTIALDPSAEESGLLDEIVSISLEETPWTQALDTMLNARGLSWTREGSVIWIHPTWSAAESERSFSGGPITLSLKDADIVDVLRVFSEQTRIAVDIDPAVEGSITIDVKDMPWDQVLDLILRSNGYEYSVDHGSVQVRPPTGGRGEILSPKDRQRALASHEHATAGEPSEKDVLRYVEGGDISKPVRVSGPMPAYPEQARKDLISGVVILETVIDSDGRVAHVDVIRGVGGGLTEAAVDAVRQWRFEPARLDGEPVAVRFVLTVRFNLDVDKEDAAG
jgi:TonB family protein